MEKYLNPEHIKRSKGSSGSCHRGASPHLVPQAPRPCGAGFAHQQSQGLACGSSCWLLGGLLSEGSSRSLLRSWLCRLQLPAFFFHDHHPAHELRPSPARPLGHCRRPCLAVPVLVDAGPGLPRLHLVSLASCAHACVVLLLLPVSDSSIFFLPVDISMSRPNSHRDSTLGKGTVGQSRVWSTTEHAVDNTPPLLVVLPSSAAPATPLAHSSRRPIPAN
ncbi:hypothetical protein DFH27DRAFT_16629 [Peziza echinospora]|nr:hypothetical protein DFH27DRAFT_16629 [Peziza echinospora]